MGKTIKIGKVSSKDIEKISRKIAREVYGIIPSKKHRNKKKYTRKIKHKSKLDL